MVELIVKAKSKTEERIVQAFLDSLEIDYYTEVEEDKALYKAMMKGKKTRRLTQKEQEDFVKSLRRAR